jgi:hypothetical protein
MADKPDKRRPFQRHPPLAAGKDEVAALVAECRTGLSIEFYVAVADREIGRSQVDSARSGLGAIFAFARADFPSTFPTLAERADLSETGAHELADEWPIDVLRALAEMSGERGDEHDFGETIDLRERGRVRIADAVRRIGKIFAAGLHWCPDLIDELIPAAGFSVDDAHRLAERHKSDPDPWQGS